MLVWHRGWGGGVGGSRARRAQWWGKERVLPLSPRLAEPRPCRCVETKGSEDPPYFCSPLPGLPARWAETPPTSNGLVRLPSRREGVPSALRWPPRYCNQSRMRMTGPVPCGPQGWWQPQLWGLTVDCAPQCTACWTLADGGACGADARPTRIVGPAAPCAVAASAPCTTMARCVRNDKQPSKQGWLPSQAHPSAVLGSVHNRWFANGATARAERR